ncbi:hypothetical protein PISMIDRAFT_675695 [Pisolithus microcarpus 441]|uniref:NACHT domain-containing protein n=1 Tax=Pisolithus microcarpus 441 TaxID=765257 RepID=A0A0C9ZLE1_9AGAM|nr:hypothetical protein PISMIDRAFT_675695 [Pisolithus microcarpus 441]
MARKWLKKRLAKPSDSDPPAGSSENAAGNVASASETSGNASRGSFSRARNLLHPTRLLLGQGSLGPTAEADLDSVAVGTQVDAARLGLEAITPVSRMGGTAINYLTQADGADTNLQSLINNYVRPLKLFSSAVTKIANVHPYAQVALGILTAAANLIISQANLDSAVSGLLEKVGFVYELLLEEDTMKHIDDMRDTLAKIARVVSDAAQFVTNYTKTQNFWKRLGLNILRETQSVVDGYTQSLDSLMQQFRDHAVRDIQINLYRVQEDLRLDGMTYAAGAGLDKTKRCLDGTRTKILQEIIHWATCGDANSPRILWLHGQAGRGKSAIAHTIASWIKDVGGLGSCFCFARDRQAEHREQKIFATIARGVADRDLAFRRALADVVSVDYDLKTTCDVIQQWQQLILEPLFKVHGSMVGNVVVVIDALDESGPETSRRHILSLLTSTEAANLPENFRILLTSRPLPDIEHALGACPHVRPTSLDNIPAEFVEHDIKLYVSKQLSHLAEIGEAEVQTIVQKSNGLFEWARLACEFVKPNKPGRTIRERFDEVAFCRFGGGGTLLDAMYKTILDDIIPNDDITDITLTRFQSVMWQIMSTFEPLHMDTLNKMRARFPGEEDHFDMIIILEFMSPLLGGIADRNTVVRPLHASFYDFLADPARSGIYCVRASDMHSLAYASLNILHGDLCFNICGLESSYLCNSEVPDLPERINKLISPHLSYSCKFWAQHLGCSFNAALATLVKVVFQSERFLFWLEALSLLDACGGAPDSLLKVTAWLQDQEGVEDSLVLAQDGIKFIQHFGNIISCSVPHLYISALPFAPSNTAFSKLIMPKFTGLVEISGGGHKEWPVIQLALQGHTSGVKTSAMSCDGKKIVSGSFDKTVRIWDAEQGAQIGDPLQGHTGGVLSVGCSPDGKRIVSGSFDNTVNSVGFSPDGKRIVSGSEDNTVRVWDAGNSAQIGIPIQGPIGKIYSTTFSPDGLRIALGSEDSSVRVLDVQNFEGMVNTFREFTLSACHSISVPVPSTGAPPICFSFASSHALQDAQQLLNGLLQEDASTWGEPVRLHPDGWIKGPKGRLLLWIPPTFWRPFYSIWTISVMPRGCCIELNLSQMVHGDKWHQCFRAV